MRDFTPDPKKKVEKPEKAGSDPAQETDSHRGVAFESGGSFGAPSNDGLTTHQHQIMSLQRLFGNYYVQRMIASRFEPSATQRLQRSESIQREGDPLLNATDPDLLLGGKAPPENASFESWPDSLPKAVRVTANLPKSQKRDPEKDTNLVVDLGYKEEKKDDTVVGPYDKVVKQTVWKGKTKVEKEYVIHAPSLTNEGLGFTGPLSAAQQQIVDKIRTNRESIDVAKKRGSGGALHLNQYAGKYGWQYGGAPKADATPTDVQGEADPSTVEGKRKRAEQYIWEELRFEGSSASINAYDSQMVTWGRGLGAKGALPPTMEALFKDSKIAGEFLRIGVCYRNGFMVVNSVTGAVETGNNALAIMQTDPHILAAMIDIGEQDENKQKIADAQWKGIRSAKTALIPFDEALDWPKELIQWMAHINHWGPAFGWWGGGKAAYKAAGPDAFELLKVFCKVAAGKANKNGAFSIRKMGPDMIANFKHWGSGVGFKALSENFTEDSLTDNDISTNVDYAGYMVVKQADAGKDGKMPVYTLKME